MQFKVKVIPNAKKPSVEKKRGYYKIKVDAPPVRGKANKRLIAILAKYFGVAGSKIKIVKGSHLRMKEIEIE